MKKSIIALAVAGAMTVPMVAQADATLFGSLRYDITDTDGQDHTDSELTRVRVGVKGEETLDSGLTAGYFIRFEGEDQGVVNSNGSTTQVSNNASDAGVVVDKVALYIAGDFGKVILGDSDTPLANVIDRATYTAVHDGSLEQFDDEATSGAITYQSHSINGFAFQANIGDVDTGDGDSDEDQYSFSVQYDNDVFGVTVAAGEVADNTNVGVSAEYKFGAGAVGVAYYDEDNNAEYTTLSAKYSIDKLTLAAQYETVDLESSSDDLEAVNISAKYDLGGNASVAASYVDYNDDAEDAGSNDQLVLRYSVSF